MEFPVMPESPFDKPHSSHTEIRRIDKIISFLKWVALTCGCISSIALLHILNPVCRSKPNYNNMVLWDSMSNPHIVKHCGDNTYTIEPLK